MINRVCNYLIPIILEVLIFSDEKKGNPYINYNVTKYFRLSRQTSKFALNIIGDMLNRVCYSFLEVMVEAVEAEDVQVDLALVHSIPSGLVWAEDVQIDSSQC